MAQKVIGVKVPAETYHQIKSIAESDGLTLSDFMRLLIENALTERKTENSAAVNAVLQALTAEVEKKNDQIAELHQLLGMAQKNVGTLTDQLSSAHAQLEDLRKPRPWWQRVFGQVT